MFNADFYPTPTEVIAQMMDGISVSGKNVLEPSAGSGNIVDWLIYRGANVIAFEKDARLREVVKSKCKVIADDFLKLESESISHINIIVMNPPFSADEHHILHAFNIAPDGCKIIALCNWQTVENNGSRYHRQLKSHIENYGSAVNLGSVFSSAERKTAVEVGLVILDKPGEAHDAEFEGFFLEEDPEEKQSYGLMPYNFVRDLVNRYIAAVRIFDEQLSSAVRLNDLLTGFYGGDKVGFQCTQGDKVMKRAEFKKELQKAAWNFIFQKMNMEKYSTKGLRQELNKFVETQVQIPFTMRNIYRMLEVVIGTHGQRMDKALIEVFDRVTMHYHENRYNVEGWKTNSHYLINKKFIMDGIVSHSYSGGLSITHYSDRYAVVDDFQKALCHVMGKDWNDIGSIWSFFANKTKPGKENSYPREYEHYEFGKWYAFGFFRVKGYRKGTMHFEFLEQDVWARFNQEISRLKGYPLFEAGRYSSKRKAA
jgi:predicted RNA methylase